MLQITETGIVIDKLTDVHQRLTEGFKRIYGDDINLDADSPDGQMIGLFSQEIDNINQAIALIAQMLDPYKAIGSWLEQRAMYAGIVRRGADYSYLNEVVITGKQGVTVHKGSLLSDDNRTKWVTLADVTLGSNGSARVDLRSQELGAFSLPANRPLTMDTVTIGVDSITTTRAAKEGAFEETDGNLLLRFMRSHAINNHDDYQGLEGALLDLPDVKQAKVYENYTNQTDEKGIPPHTLNAVVIGGHDNDIGRTILSKKVGGCGVFGRISNTQTYAGAPRTVYFDRAALVNVKVKLLLERVGGFHDIDTDAIKAALAATEFDIGESVYAMRLTCQVNAVQGFYIKSITVNGRDAVSIGVRQCAQIRPEDVEVLIE
ncbi:TPA: baseplate J/gp47 family protein [Providencia stuartii]|uniref:baseplate J/gp47 family protein n=1 Tax=Providencia stuartii TaxID=588 RepID=UPI00113FE782|nr:MULTISPECIES: baseplate J/gp47 family protein [Providencia]MBN5599519.1 baseplate J/gp47 family protein [Providencia stuartii]MBN5603425.1 baseplate J/gp47 family protein [Providencia stuartii]MCL8327195.1 baseplate J/gp47 family protein [Providencia thailandensis]MDF4176076.1 baseplate J/gp47 family protein [Providencia thailandensis]MDN0008911.1 baseplate J/gp47 family protein [Providencia stuartii]